MFEWIDYAIEKGKQMNGKAQSGESACPVAGMPPESGSSEGDNRFWWCDDCKVVGRGQYVKCQCPAEAQSRGVRRTANASFAFSVWEYVIEEVFERGWDLHTLAVKMGGDSTLNAAILDFMSLEDERIRLGEDTAACLEKAFGVSRHVWLRLDDIFRERKKQSN